MLSKYRTFIPTGTFSKKKATGPADTDVHTSIMQHNPEGDFSGVFFGFYPVGASTMEFQYHNCLFICVPASKITGKKKKYT